MANRADPASARPRAASAEPSPRFRAWKAGGGYAFLGDQVLALDKLNPQVAARIARGFDRWKRFDPAQQSKSRPQLERIRDAAGLSKDVAEIIGKALA